MKHGEYEESVRVAFVTANPDATTRLHVDAEIRDVHAEISRSPSFHRFVVTFHPAGRIDDLHRTLLADRPHILHVGTHGASDGGLFLQDTNEDPHLVEADVIEHLVATLGDDLRLVVLNACTSAPLSDRLAPHVGCAVGMDRPVRDSHARAFSTGFYRAIAHGRSVRDAVEAGRNSLRVSGGPPDAPRLVTASGVDAREIVFVAPTAARPRREIMAEIQVALGKLSVRVGLAITVRYLSDERRAGGLRLAAACPSAEYNGAANEPRYSVSDAEVRALAEAAAIVSPLAGASGRGSRLPPAWIGSLVLLVHDHLRLDARLTAEQALVLLGLETAPGGWVSPEDLKSRLPEGSMDLAGIEDALRALRDVPIGGGGVLALVRQDGDRWIAGEGSPERPLHE